MSDKAEQPLSSPISIGGVSAVMVGIANMFVPQEHLEIVTIGAPILVGFAFKFFLYLSTAFGAPTQEQLAATRIIDSQIKFLEKRIKKAKKDGRSQEHIQSLEKELIEKELARSKVDTLEIKPQQQNDPT
ncbi:hypothetical protein [Vibrio scophthalmi]|uniref:Uncharacterized protein n=1 Tax=Vibrio scophthalmi TaxID=45658 RepID=A0A1E3WMI1_9VIBR|nr:hypothetical protein [Vibrio scophthalmi]ODS10945.1 hypothetical protein VSF3289_01206 [Vibrio scophthalmi]